VASGGVEVIFVGWVIFLHLCCLRFDLDKYWHRKRRIQNSLVVEEVFIAIQGVIFVG